MPCYYPLEAYRLSSGEISFAERGDIQRVLQLPCGRCIGCRLDKARDWSVRLMHEQQTSKPSCFITLTYDDAHLPDKGNLQYVDFQKFLRRVRKENQGARVRFYMCGEYGGITNRPHYHACMFGVDFRPYRRAVHAGPRGDVYQSDALDTLWAKGYASVGELTQESAAYTARYVMKKMTGRLADKHYERLDPQTGELFHVRSEFAHMSLKPGIGALWFEKFGATDVMPHDRVMMNSKKLPVPRYYDKLWQARDPEGFEHAEGLRAINRSGEDKTFDRLRARETVAAARLRFKQRSLK